MYGQQDINICYGDALIGSTRLSRDQRRSFDLLVANPPYSVRGFLETLPEEERTAYSLTETIDDLETSNSIETFFIERAKQLLQAGGVAGHHSAVSHPRQRRQHLHQDPRNPVAVFRYRRHCRIRQRHLWQDRHQHRHTVSAPQDNRARHRRALPRARGKWFKGCDASKRKQAHLPGWPPDRRYAAHINVPLDDYKTLLKGDPNGPWTADLEADYLEKFNEQHARSPSSTRPKWFKALEAEETGRRSRKALSGLRPGHRARQALPLRDGQRSAQPGADHSQPDRDQGHKAVSRLRMELSTRATRASN